MLKQEIVNVSYFSKMVTKCIFVQFKEGLIDSYFFKISCKKTIAACLCVDLSGTKVSMAV